MSVDLDAARAIWSGGTAVVTGAGSGIGAGLARMTASLGMRVVLADLDETRMQDVAAEIERRGGTTRVVRTDVADLSAVEELAALACDEIGDVRFLANNAGIEHVGLLWEEPASSWHRLMDINLHGVYHGIRAFVPRLLAAGRPAYVLNTASVGGLSVGPYHGAYQVSKHAVVALSECLAADLATIDAPIAVSVALPGIVRTNIYIDANPETAGGEAVTEHLDFMRRMLADGGISSDEAAARILSQVADKRPWVATDADMLRDLATRRGNFLLDQADRA